MTERLSALLHQEVDTLHVPAPPLGDVLVAGRRVRRRRRPTRGVAAMAVVAAVGVGIAVVAGGDSPPSDGRLADPAPAGPADVGAGVSVGDTLYLHGCAVSATLPEVVQAMYPNSAGVVVRTNKEGSSDGGAPFHFALVDGDGGVHDLGLTLGEVVPATDPGQPYLAYATQDGATVQAVVVDVTTGREAARVDAPGAFTLGGWEAPPVAVSGDLVYVGSGKGAVVVDWRSGTPMTGAVQPVGGIPHVAGGHLVVQLGEDAPVSIVDAETGATVLDIDAGRSPYVTLSPDGRYAKAVDQESENSFEVYTVGTGAVVRIPFAPWDFGWTSDGDLFSVNPDGIRVCAPTTGVCRTSPLPAGVSLGDGSRVMGLQYES
jgi:hypothetical protein